MKTQNDPAAVNVEDFGTPGPAAAPALSSTQGAQVTAGFVAWMCFLTFVVTLAVCYFVMTYMAKHYPGSLGSAGAQEIVFVDQDKIYALKLAGLKSDPNTTAESATQDAQVFARKVDAEMKALNDQGKFVMTSQVLFGSGGAFDVTDQVAKSLGLKP